jgi:hypothetical protein
MEHYIVLKRKIRDMSLYLNYLLKCTKSKHVLFYLNTQFNLYIHTHTLSLSHTCLHMHGLLEYAVTLLISFLNEWVTTDHVWKEIMLFCQGKEEQEKMQPRMTFPVTHVVLLQTPFTRPESTSLSCWTHWLLIAHSCLFPRD